MIARSLAGIYLSSGLSTNMVAVTCWALLLLTILPLQTIAGRHLPAGPPPSSIQMQTASLVEVPAAPRRLGGRAGALVGELGDGAPFQDRSPPPDKKMIPLPNDLNQQVQKTEMDAAASIYGHRLLVGSSPPTCQGKCGTCFPCNPIHVSIGSPRGALTQQEYYPEVWRCKCGSRYFLP